MDLSYDRLCGGGDDEDDDDEDDSNFNTMQLVHRQSEGN
jgi:hypothetical protein